MKKIKSFIKSNIKTVVAFILGLIISGTSVYAATILFNSNQVGYDNTSSGMSATNVQDALDELYTKANKCESYIDPALINESMQSNTVYLTVVGKGTQQILGDNFSYTSNIDSITVNGVSKPIDKTINATEEISNVVIKFSNITPTDLAYMFAGCSSITSIKIRMDTSKTTDMDSMFYGCISLQSIDFGYFNTSKVYYMDYMFSGCSSLSNLNLSTFDTSNVIYMDSMFSGHASGLQIKAPSSVCSKIASNSGISGSYTCTQ